MKKIFLAILAFTIVGFAQEALTSVAILPSGGTLSNEELEVLTDKMRAAALKVLPTNAFILLKQETLERRLGGVENLIKSCREGCILQSGKDAKVNYVAQATVGKLGNFIRLNIELYNVGTEGLVGIIDYETEDIRDLFAHVDNNVPDLFRKCYNDNEAYCTKYGRLYDWATAMSFSSDCNSSPCNSQLSTSHKGICPSGWHITSIADWTKLVTYIETQNSCIDCAGKYLKTKTDWNSGGNGEDTYGFAALPSGLYSTSDVKYYSVNSYGYWWISGEQQGDEAKYGLNRRMDYNSYKAGFFYDDKNNHYSIRCLKN